MRKILFTFCLLALVGLPSLAADKLPPPHVTSIVAVDYSEYSTTTGWCVIVSWEVVLDADGYMVHVRGQKKKTPKPADGSPPTAPRWALTTDYGFSPDNPNAVPICELAGNQRVKFKLRAYDYSAVDPLKTGVSTAPFTLKLPKHGKTPYDPQYGAPAVVIWQSISS